MAPAVPLDAAAALAADAAGVAEAVAVVGAAVGAVAAKPPSCQPRADGRKARMIYARSPQVREALPFLLDAI